MNYTDANKFIDGLSVKDAIEILGITTKMRVEIRNKLMALDNKGGENYKHHFGVI